MAFFRISSGGSNGTTLWTGSVAEFSEKTITLSQSVDNFENIRITYQSATGDTTLTSITFPVTALKLCDSTNGKYNIALCACIDKNKKFCRFIKNYTSTTSFLLSNAYQLNAEGSNSRMVIPTLVEGLN